MSIVLPNKPSLPLQTAAAEFEKYMEEFHLAEAAASLRIAIDTDDTEPRDAYRIVTEGDTIHVVGGGGIGAIFGALELASLIKSGEPLDKLAVERKPRFPVRSVMNGEMYTKPPAGWTMADTCSWIVRHGFNALFIQWYQFQPDHLDEWHNEVLPPAEKYDLDFVMTGLLFEHLDAPEEALGKARLNSGQLIQPACLRHEWTKDRIANWIRMVGESTPRIRSIIWRFFDNSWICNHECPRCGDTDEITRAVEFTKWAQDIADSVRPDFRMDLRTWHFMPEEHEQALDLLPDKCGMVIKLANAGDEIYLPIPRYDSNYGPVDRKIIRTLKDRVEVQVPIGNCESTDSVAGLPLPALTLSRFQDLANWGGPNLENWWGTDEWTYSANFEVACKAFFTHDETPDELISQVARRDFGPALAPDMVMLWQWFERIITQWPFRSWMQRLEIFTDRAYGMLNSPATLPITPIEFDLILRDDRALRPSSRDFRRLVPRSMEALGIFKEHPRDWATTEVLEKYAELIAQFTEISDYAETIIAKADNAHRDLVREQARAIDYFRCLFRTQYNFGRAIQITDYKRSMNNWQDKVSCDAELADVAADEIENCRDFIGYLLDDPNPNIHHMFTMPYREIPEPRRDHQIGLIEHKIEAMQAWLDDYESGKDAGVPYAPYVSVDSKIFRWGDERLKSVQLTRQSRVIPWYTRDDAARVFPELEAGDQ